MIIQVITSTLLFYLFIHSIVSTLSLLVCLEDIDHFNIICPRISNSMKLVITSIYKPMMPDVIDYYVSKLMELDHWVLNTLVFSGIIVLILSAITTFYLAMTRMSILRTIAKITAFISFILWILVYVSGVGINKLLTSLHVIYSNPAGLPQYYNDMMEFIAQRTTEISEYWF